MEHPKKQKLIIIIMLLIFAALGWKLIDLSSDEKATSKTSEQAGVLSLPEVASGSIDTKNWLTYTFKHNLMGSFKYPDDWTLKSTENDGSETIALRSPKDKNGAYYCMNIGEYRPGANMNYSLNAKEMEIVEDFSAEGIGKPLKKVGYELPGSNRYYGALTDDLSVKSGENVTFMQKITSPAGRNLVAVGTYYCDESDEQVPDMPADTFSSAQMFQVAKRSMMTYKY